MFYYLETNAISKLHNSLKKIIRIKQCYTSSLSILELLRGLKDDTSFKIKKKVFQAVEDSSIRIIWSSTQNVIASAYGFAPDDEEQDLLRDIYQNILSCSDYSQFSRNKNILKLIENLDQHTDYSNNVFRNELNRTIQATTTMSNYTQRQRNAAFNFIDDFLPELKECIEGTELFKYQYAQLAAYIANKDPSYQIERALARYTNHLDPYFKAMTIYNTNIFRKEWIIKKNDLFDHKHFLYLQNNCGIVSDDKRVLKVASEALGTRCGISINQFREKYLKQPSPTTKRITS